MGSQQERELIEQAKTDSLAFGELYDLYYAKIFNYILRRVGDVAVAADITSDVFFKAMKNLPKFEWRGISFSSWIYKIASNEINNHYRKKRFWFLSLEALFDSHGFEVADTTNLQKEYAEAQEQLERQEDFKQLQKLLKKLSTKHQEVIVLRYFENKKIREISEITGKNTNTIKSLLTRGLEKLRTQLADKKGGEIHNPKTQPKSVESVIKIEGEKV